MTLAEIDARIAPAWRGAWPGRWKAFNPTAKAALVDRIQAARGQYQALLINPAAYTHTSVAIRDAIQMLGIPMVEVHLSNVYRREPFRHHSTIADVVDGRIMGFGPESYYLALRAAAALIPISSQG